MRADNVLVLETVKKARAVNRERPAFRFVGVDTPNGHTEIVVETGRPGNVLFTAFSAAAPAIVVQLSTLQAYAFALAIQETANAEMEQTLNGPIGAAAPADRLILRARIPDQYYRRTIAGVMASPDLYGESRLTYTVDDDAAVTLEFRR